MSDPRPALPVAPPAPVVRQADAPTPGRAPRAWPWAPLNPPLCTWAGRRVWLVGASSGIGLACAQALHAAGAEVTVSARSPREFEAWAQGQARAHWRALDVTDAAAVQALARALWAQGPLDLVLYCAGHYRAQRATELDLADALRHQQVNYQGALHVLAAVLPAMVAARQGHLSLVSSVAGWRGLPNGLAYGPTKAALTHLAETLYVDLKDHDVAVSVIHPGFVETPLTAQNRFAMPALMTPRAAAQRMLAGWARGDFDIHFPRRFTWALRVLRLLPYRVYFAIVRRYTGL